jgi:insertion element IS1 protein InsB
LKGRKKWIWLALNTSTREIVGVFVSSRGKIKAKGLWRSLPAIYRQCAVFYSYIWKAYAEVFPSKRHNAVGENSGKTNGVESFNCTL